MTYANNAMVNDAQNNDQQGEANVLSIRQTALPLVLQYWNIAWRRRYLILIVMAVALAAGFFATLLATEKFTSTTRIEISREQQNAVNVNLQENNSPGLDLEFYSTQYSLLKARSLAELVVRRLNLANNDAFFAAHGVENSNVGGVAGQIRGGRSSQVLERRRAQAIGWLLSNIQISPIRGSALVDVSYDSASPVISAQIANAWVDQYIRQTMDRRFASTSEARNFLETRLQDLRDRLDRSETDLVNYAAANNIVQLGSTGNAEGGARAGQTLAAADVQALNSELAIATAARVAAEGRRNATHSQRISEGALTSAAINGLRQRRAEVASELARMLVQFEPQYEPAIALRRQVESLDGAIAREESRALSVNDADYEAAVQRERGLRVRVNQLLGALGRQDRSSIHFNILQREADTNRQLYDGLLQRYKEIGATGVGVNNISIVDPAIVPVGPSSPRLLLNMALALLVGAALAGLLAIILENLDEGIRDPATINQALNVPLLGAIPKSVDEDAKALLGDPKSIISEAYMTVRSNLGFSTDHGVPKTLMVTSTSEAEGKTITSIALAAMLGRSGKRVVLIDGDMRKPALSIALGVTVDHGLSNYLAGEDVLDKIVVECALPNVAFMAAGPLPPSAAELLSGDMLGALVENLRGRYDHVMIDCPPMLGLADSALISRVVEGVVYVVQSNHMSVRNIRAALDRLREARTKIFGVVLTKYSSSSSGYGYGYGYGNGYGYGQDDSSDNESGALDSARR
ncbi:MAG: polysaccharide biosynthesis tyrosine autokinase [Sphingopyxis sp.]